MHTRLRLGPQEKSGPKRSRGRAWLSELRSRLSAFADLVEKPINVVQLVSNFSQAASAFDFELLGAGRTSENRIILKPREAVIRLMTALRTFDGDHLHLSEAGAGSRDRG